MEIIFLSHKDEFVFNEDITLCLGSFDSLHLGHVQIVKKALKSGYKTGLMTFDVNPKTVLGIRKRKQSILSLSDKKDLLEKMGVDYLFVLAFDEELMNLSRYEFIDLILNKIHPKLICCGEDYKFGNNALGNVEYLRQFFEVEEIKILKMQQKKISTADIINHIDRGEIEEANELLNRPYSIKGTVVEGHGNGKKIGFPTANIDLDYDYVLPKEGVYMGYCFIYDEKYKAIISVGTHPTIQELSKPIIEVHLLDFEGDLYGKFVDVHFIKRTRSIIKFDSLNELQKQLEKDKEVAKKELK